MPLDKQSATGSEPLPEKAAEKIDPSSEGENSQAVKKSAEQLLKEYQAEAKRKTDAIDELKSELAEMKAEKEDRLADLEEKNSLTARERREMKTLESQIADIERDERSQAWLELNRRTSMKVFSEGWSQLDKEYARDLIEDLADGENVDFDKFAKEIKPHLKRYEKERATRAVKLAYKDLKKERDIRAKLKKLEETETVTVQRETNNRTSNPTSKKETLDEARKSGNYQNLLKALAQDQEDVLSKQR